MKKAFWKKFFKVNFVVLALLFLALVLVLQSPFLKRRVSNLILDELAKVTQSEISFQKESGFIPLNFDVYNVKFKHEGKTWLTIQRLGLNRSLLHFLILKNRRLDIELDHPQLLGAAPFLNNEESAQFTWPRIPYKKMAIDVRIFSLNISEDVFQRQVTQNIDLSSSLIVKGRGKNLSLQIKAKSHDFPNTLLKIRAHGQRKQDRVQLHLNLDDPQGEILQTITKQNLPSMRCMLSLSGSPSAIKAFFNADEATQKDFRGHLKCEFFKHSARVLWQDLLNEKEAHLKSHFAFNQGGLTFENLKFESAFLNIQGRAQLDRSYNFQNTELKLKLDDLSFTKHLFKSPIEGMISGTASLKKSYYNPQISVTLNSESLAYQQYIARSLSSSFILEPFNGQEVGNYQISAELNQALLKAEGQFTYCNPHHFDLGPAKWAYSNNSIDVKSFKRLNNFYQASCSFNCQNLALFAPFIRKEIHGDAKGQAVLDMDVIGSSLTQSIKVDLLGHQLSFSKLSLNNYSFSTQGTLEQLKWDSYQGELNFSSELTSIKEYSLDQCDIYLRKRELNYFYKILAQGDLSCHSVGSFTKNLPSYTFNIRELFGSIADDSYQLTSPAQIQLSPQKIMFTELNFRVNDGRMHLWQEQNNEKISFFLKNFPIESMTYFTPGFDIRGKTNSEGYIQGIYTQVSGEAKGDFSRLRVEDYQDKNHYRGSFALSLKKNRALITLDCFRNQKDGFDFKASLPARLQLRPFSYKIDEDEAASATLSYNGALNPFIKIALPQNHVIDGNVHAELALKGSLKEPKIKGFLQLSEGYYENLFIGLALSNLSFHMSAQKNKLILKEFMAQDNAGGAATASGFLKLSYLNSFPFKINLDLEQARVIQYDFISAALSGKGVFEGSTKKAFLKGDFEVADGEVNLPCSTKTKLPQLKVKYVYDRDKAACYEHGQTHRLLPIHFNINLFSEGTTLIKGRGLDSSWSGNLAIRGTDRQPKFEGKITSEEGTFDFAGRLFELTDGTINFDGSINQDTSINLTAAQTIERHQVEIMLKGPLQGPFLTLRSSPPLSQKEVLSLVLFGQTAERLTPFQAVSLTHTLATLGGVYLGPGVVDRLRKGLGLDQLSLGSMMYNNSDFTTIQVGKYITRSVLITLSRPISADPSPFIITAQVKGGFQLQTYFDQDAISKLLLQWRFSY